MTDKVVALSNDPSKIDVQISHTGPPAATLHQQLIELARMLNAKAAKAKAAKAKAAKAKAANAITLPSSPVEPAQPQDNVNTLAFQDTAGQDSVAGVAEGTDVG